MPDFANLSEAADANPVIREILGRDCPHILAVILIASETGYRTSEASVRRWRRVQLLQADQEVAAEDEMFEDVGTGLDLGEESSVDSGWAGFTDENRAGLHQRLDETISAVNADASTITGLRVSQYETITKNPDGGAQKHQLYSVKLLVRTKDPIPEWPLVSPAPPMEIHPKPRPLRLPGEGEKITVVLPDPQIGYRFFIDTGEFDPFHDEDALDIALQVIADVQPDAVLWLGDFLDLPAMGKYEQEQAFAATTQKSVDRGARHIGEVRAVAPHADFTMLEGNHDRRLQKMITANALAAFGLRQALDTTGWPVLSVPYLCNFAELGVRYIDGYPAGEHWITDRLRAIHGSKVRSGFASTAAAVARDELVSTIFGHIHRIETQFVTRSDRLGGRTALAHSPGCLCRIDGAVPSVKGSTDLSGRPVEIYENWQQGLSVIHHDEDSFAIESVFIDTFHQHKTRYGTKTYTSRRNHEPA